MKPPTVRSQLTISIAFACGLAAASACSNSASVGATSPTAQSDARPIEITHEPCDGDAKGAVKTDVNNDGHADMTQVMSNGHEICRILDLNFDGRVDSYLYFDEAGNFRRRESDFDRDGQTDEIGYYQGGTIVRKDRETNLDGKLDTWDTYSNGKLSKRERDTNADGKIDQWWTFPDPDKPECPIVASDETNDGRPDTTQNICKEAAEELRAQGGLAPTPTAAPDAAAAEPADAGAAAADSGASAAEAGGTR